MHAIRIGDVLVVADPGRTDLSDLLLQSRGAALGISGQHKQGAGMNEKEFPKLVQALA